MKKKFIIGIDGSGWDDFQKGVEEYAKWLQERSNLLLKRLTDYGVTIADAGFQSAIYDGTNDVSVKFEDREQTVKAVVAVGGSALFIEFGTGIMYPDNHPEAAKLGMIRGEYGKGHGKQRTWGYFGEPGSNGYVHTTKRGGSVVLTHGNPANMPMYNAVKQIEQDIERIAREVFSN